MTDTRQLQDVTLIDRNGRPVGRCRVPKAPFMPSILQWGNRFFRHLMVNSQYVETTCYLVPIEDMYGAPPEPAPGPEGKSK